MTILKCGCKINHPGFGDDWIKFCPLHEAAGDLLEALSTLVSDIEQGKVIHKIKGGSYEKAIKALAEAEGK